MAQKDTWEERTLPEGAWFRGSFGPLHFLVFNRGDEWRVASAFDDSISNLPEEGHGDNLPEDLSWTRYSCSRNDGKVQLQPRFPDLPLIARPRNKFTLAPESSALFFVGVPASLEILAAIGGVMCSLLTLPVQRLSKSWHGNRSVGHPCYALRTRARRSHSEGEWPEQDVLCAVDLKNQRTTGFTFESLYLDTGHLAIFEQDGRLWSNACRVNIGEDDEDVDVTYAPRPLDPAAKAREMVAPALGRTRKSKILSAFSSFSDVLR